MFTLVGGGWLSRGIGVGVAFCATGAEACEVGVALLVGVGVRGAGLGAAGLKVCITAAPVTAAVTEGSGVFPLSGEVSVLFTVAPGGWAILPF